MGARPTALAQELGECNSPAISVSSTNDIEGMEGFSPTALVVAGHLEPSEVASEAGKPQINLFSGIM